MHEDYLTEDEDNPEENEADEIQFKPVEHNLTDDDVSSGSVCLVQQKKRNL